MSYSEIHFHILDGIDDGPATLDQSVALARLSDRLRPVSTATRSGR
jgi:tyrosine-protein phosphatase YwqE